MTSSSTTAALSHPTAEKISGQSSKKSAKSKTADYLFLDLRKDGQKPEKSWRMISLLPGEHSMLNTGVYPKEECVSTLSQILQAQVPQKYYLSQKACLGILRRASERGKKLPAVLKIALRKQAQG